MEIIETLYNQFIKSKGVTTDTRNMKKGQIFFALKGPSFNGNEYVNNALESGAMLCVIDEKHYEIEGKTMLVDDVLTTLQILAKFHRQKLNIPIFAITGSNGKTTTKELLAAVISSKYKCQYTKGNLNNHIGVPLTLLDIKNDCEFSIVEMGANNLGEIKVLAEIAQPTHGLITNIGKAHLEGFGDLEGVLSGKTELYQVLRKHNGIIIINEDDQKLNTKTEECDNLIGYKLSNLKALKVSDKLTFEYKGDVVRTNLVGDYNLYNLAPVIRIGELFDVEWVKIKEALESYHPNMNRSQSVLKDGHVFVLDAYNANPSSMNESINSFNNNFDHNKILILGEMLELGRFSQKEHSRILDDLDLNSFKYVCLIGDEFKNISNSETVHWFENVDELNRWFKDIHLEDKHHFLIKGSRSNRLERFNDLSI